jgi:hypothetical protein
MIEINQVGPDLALPWGQYYLGHAGTGERQRYGPCSCDAPAMAQKIIPGQSGLQHGKTHSHSVLSAFTGSAIAARMACQETVRSAPTRASNPTSTNTPGPISIRYAKSSSHRLIRK